MAAVGDYPVFQEPRGGVFDEQPLKYSASASASPPPSTAASPPPTVTPTSVEDLEKLQFTNQPIVNVATCNLNQFALDFTGNQRRIIESIIRAKAAGCTYRLGPELEITGYSCEDHFYEIDTISFAWMSLRDIILTQHEGKDLMSDILCDFGMPVLHNGVRYNCRIFVLGRQILLVRPKMWMADDGNYREDRHFTPWDKDKIEQIEEYQLPESIHSALQLPDGSNQKTAPFGVAIIQCIDGTIGAEICEELFTAESTNILLGFEGCDIMSNGSASHFEIGKRLRRHDLIKEATKKNGGVYMYSNMIGCDGNRMVFDGNGMIYMNGELKAVGEHLLFHEIEVVTAKLNLNEVRTYRAKSVSHQMQSDQRSVKLQRIKIDFNLTKSMKASAAVGATTVGDFSVTETIDIPQVPMEEEMGLAVSRWVFDYLTRSGAGSFLLPLSGGVDSSSTAMFIYFMCSVLVELLNREGNDDQKIFLHKRLDVNVLRHAGQYAYENYMWNQETKSMSAVKNQSITPLTDPKILMNLILYTVNMPTRHNTSKIMLFALNLADALGSYHITADIDNVLNSVKDIVSNLTFGVQFSSKTEITAIAGSDLNPGGKFKKASAEKEPSEIVQIPRTEPRDGIFANETLAIQNIQARLRMITAFYLAQVLPSHRNVVEKMNPDGSLKAYQSAKKLAEIAQLTEEGKDIETTRRENHLFVNKLDATGKKLHGEYTTAVSGAQMCLVLASSNSDEALRGFYTKYDAASADINPIGSFSKHDLRKFLFYCMGTRFRGAGNDIYSEPFSEETIKTLTVPSSYPFKILWDILTVVASPELQEPGAGGAIQDDEIAIKVTYEDLYEFGIMRKDKLGPIGMFYKMCRDRLGKIQAAIYEKTRDAAARKIDEAATPLKIFKILDTLIKQYGLNRHKMTILTPSLHATNYSPDDNRFDQRPFLYPNEGGNSISYQLNIIKQLATQMESRPDIIEKVAAAQRILDSRPAAAAARASSAPTASGPNPAELGGTPEEEELGGGARRNLTHLRRVTRDKKRNAKKRQTRKS